MYQVFDAYSGEVVLSGVTLTAAEDFIASQDDPDDYAWEVMGKDNPHRVPTI